jgi:hypothetical protein
LITQERRNEDVTGDIIGYPSITWHRVERKQGPLLTDPSRLRFSIDTHWENRRKW